MRVYLAALCLALFLTALPVSAATAENGSLAVELSEGKAVLVDSDGDVQAEMENASEDAGEYTFEVTPGRTYYLNLGSPADSKSMLAAGDGSLTQPVRAGELADSTVFKLRNEKSGSGAGLVSTAQYNEKTIGDSGRCSWLQFVVANTVATEELKAVCGLTFSAQRDDPGGRYSAGDCAELAVTLYIQAEDRGESGGSGAGGASAEAGGQGKIVWEGTARLSYSGEAPWDGGAELSTDSEEYWSLADEADAEIFVRDFTEFPALNDGPLARLTLLNPWEVRSGGNVPDPEQCRIYEQDSDGRLADVTGLFTYGEDERIGCWQIRTRRPGCYILSDRELDTADWQPETE